MHRASDMFMRRQSILSMCAYTTENGLWLAGLCSLKSVGGFLLAVSYHGKAPMYPASGGDEAADTQMLDRGPLRSSTAPAVAQPVQIVPDHPEASMQQIEAAAANSQSVNETLPNASSTQEMSGHATSTQPVSSTGIISVPASLQAAPQVLEHIADHAQPAAGGKSALTDQANGTTHPEVRQKSPVESKGKSTDPGRLTGRGGITKQV